MSVHGPDLSLLLFCYVLHITGTTAGASVRSDNITATAGSDVTLRCELLLGDTKVTQVNWNFCNDVHIAFHVNNYKVEGKVLEEFSDRMSLAKDYGITISNVNGNDTRLYCCIYNTFPRGKFTGKIYLQVLDGFPWTHGLYLGVVMGFGILLLVSGSVGIFCYRRKSRGIQSSARPMSTPAAGSAMPSSILTIRTAEEDVDDSHSQDYFNVILYKDIYTI
ncbi:T-cell immunoreceptor with Ig and ITIM domains isoform X2 [Pseudophryne corroboree]|uniref:T-cell immunoreceptor with Ig and ITIM domains isoform X2 n=1 Tax=Pseudophryne corroboree TaxID=495146 RepID=UPI00308163A0